MAGLSSLTLGLVLGGRVRHRADEGHPDGGGRAGHLSVRLWGGSNHLQGLRDGGRGLRGQALLADRTGGESRGGHTQAGRPGQTGPSGTFVLGELTIDYGERRMSVAGRAVQLTATEYELLFELSANAGRVMTYDRPLQRVLRLRSSADSRQVRTAPKQLRRKLGDDANNPTTFSQSRASATVWRRGEGKKARRRNGQGTVV